MRLLLICFLCCLGFRQAAADPYLLFKEKDKIGIKDNSGKIVIPATFDGLGWSDGSFSVVGNVTGYLSNNHWGLINLKKEFLTKAEFETLTYHGGDRIIVRKKINAVQIKTGCLNLRGEVVVPFLYDGIQINGLRGIVFNREKSTYVYGLIDLNGQVLVPIQYSRIEALGTLRYALRNSEGKTALYSDQGKPIIGFKIDSISTFNSTIAIIYQERKQGAINRDGEIIIEPIYREIKISSDGSIQMRKPDEWKVLNGENKELRKVEADELIPFGKDLFHIAQGNLHGLVNRKFEVALPLEYTWLGPPQNGTLVARKTKYGLIRENGTIILPFEFDSVWQAGRLVGVKKHEHEKSSWLLYDTFGIKKTSTSFEHIGAFNGQFFPSKKNGYWGGIDRYGIESIYCVYDSLIQVSGDLVAVKFKGQFGIISTNEKWLLLPQPYRVSLVSSERYLLHEGRNHFLKDFSGQVIYFTENKLIPHTDFMTEVSSDGLEKQVDYQGRIVNSGSPAKVENATQLFPESEGLRGILKDGKFGFVDNSGRLRIANRYDGIGLFKEGIAPVKIIGKWGYINRVETFIIQPTYEMAGEFSGGHALVKRSGKYGIVDKEGIQIISPRYDSIGILNDGNFLLKSGSQFGLSDKNGKTLLDTRYDHLEDLHNGYCIIRRDGKSGLLTLQGLSTIPLIYDQLIFDKEKNEYLGLVKSGWRARK